MPAVFKEGYSRQSGDQSHSRHRANSRNPGESLAHRMCPMNPEDPVVEQGDPAPDRRELIRKESEHLREMGDSVRFSGSRSRASPEAAFLTLCIFSLMLDTDSPS